MKKVFTFLLLVIFNYSYSQSINNNDINQEIDSVKKLVNTTNNQNVKLKNLVELCNKYYYDFYDSDSLSKYTRIGIDISIKSKQDSFLILFYNYTVANYNDYGVYDKALEVNIDILKIAEKMNDEDNIANTKVEMANIYTNTNDYALAKKYYYEALNFRKKEKIRTYNDTLNWCYIYGNLGRFYSVIKNFDSSIFYYKKNLELLEKNATLLNYLVTTYINLGDDYLKKGDFENAKLYSFKSYETASSSLMPEAKLAASLNQVSKIFLKDNKYDSAIYFSQKAYSIFSTNSLYTDIVEPLVTLIESYSKINDFKNAFKYSQLLNDTKDTLSKNENLGEIENIKFKEKVRIEEIEKERARQIKLRNNTFQIIGLALFAFVSFFILFYKRNNQSKYLKFFKNIIVLLVLSIISFLIGPFLNSITNDTPIYIISFSIISSLIFSPLENRIRATIIFK
jgi:tetratricopeptide (TPR) repeat protein